MIELRFSLPPAGMRRNYTTNRFVLKKLKDEYSKLMGIEIGQKPNVALYKTWARRLPIREYLLNAEVIWRQTGEGDTDNCLSACKAIFDNLGVAPPTKAGLDRFYIGIYDSDSQIRRICVERERVAHKSEQCVILRLEGRDQPLDTM